jgi:hypothetical protein
MGILRLSKTYSSERLEAAAQIALTFGFVRVQQIADLLKNGMDKKTNRPIETIVNRDNIRGSTYYADADKEEKDVINRYI